MRWRILTLLSFLVWPRCTCCYGYPSPKASEVQWSADELNGEPEEITTQCQIAEKPKGLGFIGIKYDLLQANPDGNGFLGGVDPGLVKNKRILKLTYKSGQKVAREVCYAARQSCTSESTSKVITGTQSYQKKLMVGVSISGIHTTVVQFTSCITMQATEKKIHIKKKEGKEGKILKIELGTKLITKITA